MPRHPVPFSHVPIRADAVRPDKLTQSTAEAAKAQPVFPASFFVFRPCPTLSPSRPGTLEKPSNAFQIPSSAF